MDVILHHPDLDAVKFSGWKDVSLSCRREQRKRTVGVIYTLSRQGQPPFIISRSHFLLWQTATLLFQWRPGAGSDPWPQTLFLSSGIHTRWMRCVSATTFYSQNNCTRHSPHSVCTVFQTSLMKGYKSTQTAHNFVWGWISARLILTSETRHMSTPPVQFMLDLYCRRWAFNLLPYSA